MAVAASDASGLSCDIAGLEGGGLIVSELESSPSSTGVSSFFKAAFRSGQSQRYSFIGGHSHFFDVHGQPSWHGSELQSCVVPGLVWFLPSVALGRYRI